MEVLDKRVIDSEGNAKPEIRRGRSIQNVFPAFDRVLVKLIPIPQGETLIARPSAFDEPTDLGEVVAVGKGVYVGGQFIAIPFLPGDIVKFGALSREDAEFQESDREHQYAFVRAQDVRCFWKPE